MTEKPAGIYATIAPLKNVTLMGELMDRVMKRANGLPGMACFYGPSGYGKTSAAIYAANKTRAYHIQVQSVWGRRKICHALATELQIEPAATIADTVDLIGHELGRSRRPLIVDEADFLLKESLIEMVRDIYEASQGTIILIGEENLPQRLKKWERVHGRMLDWVGAQPASLADAKHLARLYCPGIEVADDLLAHIHQAAAGSIRRICVNLSRIHETAQREGLRKIARPQYTDDLFTGNPPARPGLRSGA